MTTLITLAAEVQKFTPENFLANRSTLKKGGLRPACTTPKKHPKNT